MKAVPALLLLLALTLPGAAQEAQEDPELAALMSELEKETEIATKTRMNSDYVPGIVTVLEGEELEALGFETVWEALALVPGVQPVRDGSASPSVIVRGIQFPFNNGNIKILIDGVPLSRETAGINSSALFVPMEMVERIEFIRGPGSVIYGDFAFMGIVNIITKREGVRVYVRGDSQEAYSGGVRLALGNATSPWQFSVNLSGLGASDTHAPVPRTAEEERHTALLSLRHGGLSLSGQVQQRDIGDTTNPPIPGPAVNSDEFSWAWQVRYGRTLAKDLTATATATVLDTRMDAGITHYDDRVRRLGVDVQWDGLARQSWLASAEFINLEIQNAQRRGPANTPQNFSIRGARREVKSVTLQDRLDFGESVSVTAGARIDDYNDVASRVTPRLSVVWRASDRHILKAQYAEGFRAPTFFELYSGGVQNRNLDFEVNATTELNYVFRRPRTIARATLFHTDLKDMVFGGAAGRFGNTREASAEGIELEWTQQISDAVKLIANAAWFETEDNRGPTLAVHESESAPDWMSDVAVLVRPFAETTVSLHWNHVGDRQVVTDVGEGYDVVDLTAGRQNLFGWGLGVRGGVKNATGDDLRYVNVRPTGQVDATRFEGRTWWIQLSWRG